MSEEDDFKKETEKSIEALRKKVVDQITVESEFLIGELLDIARDPEVDARVKLQAIGMLLDRAVPKLGVDHAKMEEDSESRDRKRLREEIESLLAEDDEEEDDT